MAGGRHRDRRRLRPGLGRRLSLEGAAGRPARHLLLPPLRPLPAPHAPGRRGRRSPGILRPLLSWLAPPVDRRPLRPVRGSRGGGAGRLGAPSGRGGRGRGLLRQQHGRHVRERAVLRALPARPARATLLPDPPAGQRSRRRGGAPSGEHGAGGDLLLRLRLRSARRGRGAGRGARGRGGGGPRGRVRFALPAHLRRLQRPALGGRGPLPAVPRRPRGHVVWRRRGRAGAGAAGAGAGPGGGAAGGARRGGRLLRRPPHDGAGPLRDGRRGGAGGGAGRRRPAAGGGGLRQRPRHGHAAQRRRRVAGAEEGLRRPGRRAAAGRHQGADRPSARLLRRYRGGGHGALPASRRAASGGGRRGGGPGAAGHPGARRASPRARRAGGGLHQPRVRWVQRRAGLLALGGSTRRPNWGSARLSEPVLITGLGTLGAWGGGADRLAAAVAGGVPLAGEVDRWACYHLPQSARRACLVPPGDLAGWLSPGEARRMSPPSKLAVTTARMALRCAGICDGDSEAGAAVGVATAFGPSTNTEALLKQILDEGPEAASPSLFMESVANAPAAQIAIALKARGASLTVCEREAGPLIALGTGAAEIAAGRAHRVLAGTVDEMIPILHAILDRFGALARGGPEGEELARPFGLR